MVCVYFFFVFKLKYQTCDRDRGEKFKENTKQNMKGIENIGITSKRENFKKDKSREFDERGVDKQ